MPQGHCVAHFFSSCSQNVVTGLALTLAPGGQILGRQPLSLEQSQRLSAWQRFRVGEGKKSWFSVTIPAAQLQPLRWLSVIPSGQKSRTEDDVSYPPPSSPSNILLGSVHQLDHGLIFIRNLCTRGPFYMLRAKEPQVSCWRLVI